MRRLWIHHLLPLLFVILPALGAALIFAALPEDARRDYLARVAHSPIDWVILALGTVLYLSQTLLAWYALKWRNGDFDTRPDKWLSHLAQGAEWFPLLGLIGTVAAILQTFGSITPGSNPTPQDIIRRYAPAITATGSGLFMALLNILPVWVANLGRDIIRGFVGDHAVPLTAATNPSPGAAP
jgi:hypothetical protein